MTLTKFSELRASPLIVSYGGGTNSTALLIGLKERGIRPFAIMFADTGNEKPGTYEHLFRMQEWAKTNDFPEFTIVRNTLPQGLLDGSLYDECFRLGTMPSKLFGHSTCSMKWKVTPQIQATQRLLIEHQISHVNRAIGYDADEIHRAEKPKPVREWETNWYPLIEWGWGRDECVEAIARAGLPQPGKSACFMCPSSKKPEVVWLSKTHPDLYSKAIAMERRALAGEGQAPAARVKGLGRHWNWETLEGVDTGTPEVDCGCYDGD